MLKTTFTTLFDSQKRISWRRLSCLILGTALLLSGFVTSEEWLWLALTYVAGDSAEKALQAFKR